MLPESGSEKEEYLDTRSDWSASTLVSTLTGPLTREGTCTPRHPLSPFFLTCEVVEAVSSEGLVNDVEHPPHVGRDGDCGEQVHQDKHLLVKVYTTEQEWKSNGDVPYSWFLYMRGFIFHA